MTTNTGKPLSRRTALRNMGAAAALPLVDRTDSSFRRAVEGKVALVTGSGRNLGRAAVLELARQGANVVVNARSNRAEADAVAREAEALGVRAIALLADVGDEQQVIQMVDDALERLGRIDILINNAGFRGSSSIAAMSTEEWRAATAVNYDGPFFCTRAVVPGMISNGYGRIITVSGLNSFHAVEPAPNNITVNHVVPGAYVAHPNLSQIPLGRVGLPQELANMYAFLSSEEASYITGQTFHVNGGEVRY